MDRNKATKTKTSDTEVSKQQLVDHLLSLSPEDRTQRLLIEPDYPNVRDEIIEPDRVTMQTWYFWKKWAPILGPVATTLFIRLRMYCYYNRQTGELRDWCYPSQTTLAQEIGLKDKKAVMRAIRLLEEHGLVKREAQYRYDEARRKKVRTTDLYRIMMSDVLAPEDEPEVVVRMAERIMTARSQQLDKLEVGPMSQKGTQVSGAVDNRPPKSQKGTYYSGPKKGQEEVPLRRTPNVDNVGLHQSDPGLRDHPTVRQMTTDQKAYKENLALEIGERLKEMAGDRGFKEHQSAGFHRRVAFLLPESLVNEALVATRDALDDVRSGRKQLRTGPAAYFAGIVHQVADREQIDIGVQWKAKSPAERR